MNDRPNAPDSGAMAKPAQVIRRKSTTHRRRTPPCASLLQLHPQWHERRRHGGARSYGSSCMRASDAAGLAMPSGEPVLAEGGKPGKTGGKTGDSHEYDTMMALTVAR